MGNLIVEEADGIVTDLRGTSIPFGPSSELTTNQGIIACIDRQKHPKIISEIGNFLIE